MLPVDVKLESLNESKYVSYPLRFSDWFSLICMLLDRSNRYTDSSAGKSTFKNGNTVSLECGSLLSVSNTLLALSVEC